MFPDLSSWMLTIVNLSFGGGVVSVRLEIRDRRPPRGGGAQALPRALYVTGRGMRREILWEPA